MKANKIIGLMLCIVLLMCSLVAGAMNLNQSGIGGKMTSSKKIAVANGSWVMAYYGLFEGWDKLQKADFKKVSHLLVAFAHCSAQRNAHGSYVLGFEIFNNPPADWTTPSQEERFKQLCAKARHDNPNIAIIISQGFSENGNEYGRSFAAPAAFAHSVRDFVEKYDLDGYDMDCESESVSKPEAAVVFFKTLRADFNALAVKTGKRYYIGATPFTVNFLDDNAEIARQINPYLDFLNLQTYASIEEVEGIDRKKYIYGVSGEQGYTSRTVKRLAQLLRSQGGLGMYDWRLDGGKELADGQPTLNLIYDALNPASKAR